MQKNILVPVSPRSKDLGAVQHAFALAKRIMARVFILKLVSSQEREDLSSQEEDILGDLVTTAWQSGLNVSYHTAWGPLEEAVIDEFLHQERIHILVLGEEWKHLDRLFLHHQAAIPAQVILVRHKKEEAGLKGKNI